MTSNPNTRLAWLDTANVLAMLCVVWFHIPSQLEEPIRGLEYICVNIPFFMFSGLSYAISRKSCNSFVTYLGNTIRKLYIPTLFFFSFFYILWLIVGKALAGDQEPWFQPLIELFCGSLQTVLATFWFVICLLVIRLIFFILSMLFQDNAITYFICSILPFLTLFLDIPNYYELNRALLFIPYFSLGCSLFHCHNKNPLPLVFSLTGIVGYFVITVLFIPDTGNYAWYEVTLGLTLAFMIVLLSISYNPGKKGNSIINLLRYGSIVILATQNYIIGFTRVLFERLSPTPDYLDSHIILKPIVLLLVYVLTIPVIVLIKNYAPFVLGHKNNTKH